MNFKNVLNDKSFEESLVCIICKDVLCNPYDCSSCSQSYCFECINIKTNCPNCKTFIKLYPSSNNLKRIIDMVNNTNKGHTRDISIWTLSGKKNDNVNDDNEKLDRILDTVQNIQNLIFFKNIGSNLKEQTDTPKFSLNIRKESIDPPQNNIMTDLKSKLEDIENSIENNYNIQNIIYKEISKNLDILVENKLINSSAKKIPIKQDLNRSPKKLVNTQDNLNDRINMIEKNIISKINRVNAVDMNEKLISELKNCLIEVSLDTSSLIIEKLNNIENLISIN